jgi:hypothetical protein
MNDLKIEANVRGDLARQGFAWVPRSAWRLSEELRQYWECLREDWNHLELDRYLEMGARFRLRRYGRFYWSPAANVLEALPDEAYCQDKDENPYAGGVAREFAALLPATVRNPIVQALVSSTFASLPIGSEKREKTWEVRVHQIRIVATPEQPGLPAPEGIHQDGTNYLTFHLVQRGNIAGGQTTIYDLDRRPIAHYTMQDPLDSMILEDARIMHGVTPVQSADGETMGTRDLLGVDFLFSPHLQPPEELV